ncbi:uncharacterized protein LOC129319178 [Prosopis cineraria]|uniref:uncharacterized protein LOC129319178 n=1 Tax=Prosopis cineraria TaxID=364024 RepID=UPI00240EE250|nr:uncharacterized protein LOC129319178 [Prosopis cineraria]
MRPSLVCSLLLLSLLLAKVQGIRLDRESLAVQQQKQQDKESTLMEKSNGEAEEVNLCKDEQRTGTIKSRKLVTTSISSTHELSKNKVKKEGDEAHFSVNGNTRKVKPDGEEEGIKVQTLPTSEHRGLHHEQYPDLVDIAEMDYSPARRKPPIHN